MPYEIGIPDGIKKISFLSIAGTHCWEPFMFGDKYNIVRHSKP